MGLMLPGELADLLNELGYTWPKSDEEKLFQIGQRWLEFSDSVQTIRSDLQPHAERAWADSAGDAIEAFRKQWEDRESAPAVLEDGTTGAAVIGSALFVCAAVVLALKINVIVQLTILLIEIIEAIATAPATFGGSLLEIPVFKKIADMAINLIVNQAVEAILG